VTDAADAFGSDAELAGIVCARSSVLPVPIMNKAAPIRRGQVK